MLSKLDFVKDGEAGGGDREVPANLKVLVKATVMVAMSVAAMSSSRRASMAAARKAAMATPMAFQGRRGRCPDEGGGSGNPRGVGLGIPYRVCDREKAEMAVAAMSSSRRASMAAVMASSSAAMEQEGVDGVVKGGEGIFLEGDEGGGGGDPRGVDLGISDRGCERFLILWYFSKAKGYAMGRARSVKPNCYMHPSRWLASYKLLDRVLNVSSFGCKTSRYVCLGVPSEILVGAFISSIDDIW